MLGLMDFSIIDYSIMYVPCYCLFGRDIFSAEWNWYTIMKYVSVVPIN